MLSSVSFKVWDSPDLLHLIKKELLSKEIYKKELDSSRLKNIYNGTRETPNGLSIITAHLNDKIIGVITCEHPKFNKVPAITLKDPFKMNSKVKSTEDWSCISLGFIGVYVDGVYRNNGLGAELVRQMESLRIKSISEEIKNDDISFFTAAEAAVRLVKNASQYSYVSDREERSLWFHHGIHEITQAAKTHRMGETYFGNNAPIKASARKLLFKSLSIKI